jgi:hypothetical protein
MLQPSVWFTGCLMLIMGLAIGVGSHVMWARQQAKARRRVPRHWSVDSRRIVNADEAAVWRFLLKTFPDHEVMVKLPFTRFTMPQGAENKVQLFEHLSKVYCTFTVSTREGKVIGCVDVGGRKQISRSNQLLKLTLLSQCDICYWAVEQNGQLRAEELRAYFLDAEGSSAEQTSRKPELSSAQVQLREIVERQRQQRRTSVSAHGRDRLEAPSSFGGFADSGVDSGSWQTPDSFIAPLETRPGPLQ